MLELTYVLPLKWSDELDRSEMADYLRGLADQVAEVIVVDGSEIHDFEAGVEAWGEVVKVLRPDPDLRFANGKVNGVTTGMRVARYESVVIADDDVRYDAEGLRAVARALEVADLVIPQNHFVPPLPWHAYIDSSRSLLNRALGHDFPGTLGVRRSFFEQIGGYDGNVMFENLELIRTVIAAEGRVRSEPSIYVPRLAPTARRYLSQRVRQAYDDFARPGHMAMWLSLAPAVAASLRSRRRRPLFGAALASIVLAETGRRKEGGRERFPLAASLCAPLWLAERAVASWLAVGARLRGGVRYGDRRILRAARP